MATVRKKIWPEYYEAILSGKKKFEVRLNEFDVSAGDVLLLEEWDPKSRTYTGRSIEKNVTYVSAIDIKDSYWPKEEIETRGLLVLSLE